MKQLKWLLGTMALGMLSACSSDAPGVDNGGKGESKLSYLSVNIYNSNGNSTRAENSGDPTSENAKYEDGTATENAITSIRFFFFKENGDPVNVKYDGTETGTFQSYYDFTPAESDFETGTAPNIEKIVKAQIVLSTENGDNVAGPAKMVAVINPSQAFEENTNTSALTLTQLKGIAKDYAADVNGTPASNFAMTNSVYTDASNTVVFENTITDKVKTSESLATNDPVDVYVERTVAKVSVVLDNISDAVTVQDGTVIPLKVKNGETTTEQANVDGNDLYLKITKWNVATTAQESNLVKSLDGISDLANFSTTYGFALSVPDYHRSFWATNTSSTFNTTIDYDGLSLAMGTGATYVNENTNETNKTKVVIAAEICTKDGNTYTPFTYIKRGGVNYTETGFENYILAWIKQNVGDIYVVSSTEGGTGYKTIGADDITYTTTAAVGEYSCYVYPSLKSTTSYYKINDAGSYELISNQSTINETLKTFGKISYYNDGKCYYYFDIEHLGDATHTHYAVVRNHVYKCTVESIIGFGTPVYDTTEDFVPTKPTDEVTHSYVAARVNVLSWRIVSKKYTIEW